MEPMNAFLVQHRESFKSFVDEVCHVPTPLSSNGSLGNNSPVSPTYPPGVVSAEQHLSYTTPMTIMQRLPPSSREGFPSLPYLIDQARSFADLIHLWLEAVSALSNKDDSAALPGKTHLDVLAAIEASEGDLTDFHRLCEELNTRTQECLNRAERAERPDSPHSFQWEDVISQLQKAQIKSPGGTVKDPFDIVADKIASDPNLLPEDANPAIEATLAQLRGQISEDTDEEQQGYGKARRSDSNMTWDLPRADKRDTFRPGSASLGSSLQGKSIGSPGASASASQSNISSAVSSDTEHANSTTALPSYEREVRHRERREQARAQIQKQMEAARVKEKDKEKKKTSTVHNLVPKLKKRTKNKDDSANGMSLQEGNGMI